jgi:hypothetical protein
VPLAHEINAVRNQQVILDRNLTELDRMEAQPERRQVISGKLLIYFQNLLLFKIFSVFLQRFQYA